MHKQYFLLSIVSFFVIYCLTGNSYAMGEEMRRNSDMPELIFIVKSDKAEYRLGERIVLHGILQNQSKISLMINSKFLVKGSEIEADDWGIGLKIVAPSGKKVDVGWLYEISDVAADWFVLLTPGEEYSSEIWGNIGPLCKEIGTYRLTAYYYNFIGESLGINAWKGSVESGSVEFCIE